MAAAFATPDPTSDKSGLYLIPVTILVAISLPLVVGRIITRLRRTKHLFLDDWIVIFCEVTSVANYGIACAAFGYKWGHQYLTIEPEVRRKTLKLQFALQTSWLFTLCAVRVCVAVALLRFGQDRLWRSILYFIIVLQCCISTSYLILQFGQCRPISWQWENVPDVKCWNINAIIDYGWAVAAIYVIMDLTLALMPIRLIRTLNRPKTEKILICFLMSLGLLATIMAGIKMTTFKSFGKGDPMQSTIRPSTYAKIEEQVGIIACCLPCLKSPAEKLLRRFGVLNEHEETRPSFVQSLPELQQDERSSGDGSLPSGKDEVRIDSVGISPKPKTEAV